MFIIWTHFIYIPFFFFTLCVFSVCNSLRFFQSVLSDTCSPRYFTRQFFPKHWKVDNFTFSPLHRGTRCMEASRAHRMMGMQFITAVPLCFYCHWPPEEFSSHDHHDTETLCHHEADDTITSDLIEEEMKQWECLSLSIHFRPCLFL